jgi:hypothetical protein
MAICSVSSIAPVSCFLFVIVMEAFSKMLNATVDRGLLPGFFEGSRHSDGVGISHLLFTDDNLVFVGSILIMFAICVLHSYVLKLSPV